MVSRFAGGVYTPIGWTDIQYCHYLFTRSASATPTNHTHSCWHPEVQNQTCNTTTYNANLHWTGWIQSWYQVCPVSGRVCSLHKWEEMGHFRLHGCLSQIWLFSSKWQLTCNIDQTGKFIVQQVIPTCFLGNSFWLANPSICVWAINTSVYGRRTLFTHFTEPCHPVWGL